MTLDEALDQIDVGQSIEQTIWTQHPGGADIVPEEGTEYQVKLTIVKEEGGRYSMYQRNLAKRQKGS